MQLPKDLVKEIIDYSTEHYYVLLDWIDESKLDIEALCKNNKAGDYIKELLDKPDKILKSIDDARLSALLTIETMQSIKNELFTSIINLIRNKLNWSYLSSNPSAIKILQANPDKINWKCMSANPAAIDMIKEKLFKEIKDDYPYIYWHNLSKNEEAVDILKEYPEKIHWRSISENPAAYDFIEEFLDEIKIIKERSRLLKPLIDRTLNYEDLLNWEFIWDMHTNPVELSKKYPHRIDWDGISFNKNAIELIKENPDKINWKFIMQNEGAIDIIKETLLTNPEKINLSLLCRNKMAIDIIKEILLTNPEKINWNTLCKNRNSMDILKENQDRINWVLLSENQSIFKSIRDDIIKKTMNLIY